MLNGDMARLEDIKNLFQSNQINKIQAVKLVLEGHIYDLREAKHLVYSWDDGYVERLRKALHLVIDTSSKDKLESLARELRLIV